MTKMDALAQMDALTFDRMTAPVVAEPELTCHGGCSGATHASDCDLAGMPRRQQRPELAQ